MRSFAIAGAVLCLAGATTTLGCADSSEATAAGTDALTSCPEAVGTLTLLAIPPSTEVSWASPNTLINSMAASLLSEELLVHSGQAGTPHPEGHTLVELECGDLSFPLTGQTGGQPSLFRMLLSGVGGVAADNDGTLNEFPEVHDDTVLDVQRRQASGHLSRMSFKINRKMCERLRGYHDEYIRRGAFHHFLGQARARRFEGSGCAGFATSFVDVGSLLHRSQFTPLWTRSLVVGNARFSNFLGEDRLPYGSNLLARLSDGHVVTWPKGVDFPARRFGIVLPESSVLDAWSGPEDTPFDIPGQALPSELKAGVPETVYDPLLIAHWIDSVWKEAQPTGKARFLEADWSSTMTGQAKEVVTDARCKMPPSTPFDGDRDSLFDDAE
jgi:hypothetical protein